MVALSAESSAAGWSTVLTPSNRQPTLVTVWQLKHAGTMKRMSHYHLHDESAGPLASLSLLGAFTVSVMAGLLLFNVMHGQHWETAEAAAAAAGSSGQTLQQLTDPHAGALAALGQRGPEPSLQILMETRVCGSPATDGYAHVDDKCLLNSPTARWYRDWVAGGGRPEALVVHLEPAADIDGIAVKWGINNKYRTAEECAEDCWSHRPGKVEGPFQALPCNSFSWCGAAVCFEPDAHNHTQGDCWLKWTEAPASPEINMRGNLPPDFRQRHPTAPGRVQWVAGVLLPAGVRYNNGTWSPRWSW